MTQHHRMEYRAYLWTLIALVLVYFGTIAAAGFFPQLVGKLEVFGLGTVTGGLIGLLRIPRSTPAAGAGDPEPPADGGNAG